MRKFFIAAALAVVAMFGSTKPAEATFEISVAEVGVDLGNGVGNAIVVLTTASDFTPQAVLTGTYGDFTVQILGGAGTNNATLSSLLSSTTSVTNNDTAAHTLQIYVTQTNYTLPVGPKLTVESGMGGTVNVGLLANGNLAPNGLFQAYADATNALYGTGFTNGPQVDSQTGSTFDTGGTTGQFTRGAGNYSVTSLATLTMSGGGNVNYSNHVNLTAVPAPAGLVLALAGLPVFGLGAYIRRRRVVTA